MREITLAVLEFLKAMLPWRMKGKTVMWWITANVFGMCWYTALTGKSLDGSIAVIYGIAVGAFAGGKGFEYYQQHPARKQAIKRPDPLPAGTEDPPGGYL